MRQIFIALLLFVCLKSEAQNNPFGLVIIDNMPAYRASIQGNKNNELIEIKQFIPNIKLDIRYAGKNNFAKQPVYSQARAFARRPVVEALKKVQNELKTSGLGLKIYDGYRPYKVTVKFFDIASDKSFVANPKDGSRHNRGCAIDLTLINLRTGKELLMPTPYDSFAPEAASDFQELDSLVIQNREVLRSVMEKNGFKVLKNEWWHFDFMGWKDFTLMDIPFENL